MGIKIISICFQCELMPKLKPNIMLYKYNNFLTTILKMQKNNILSKK